MKNLALNMSNDARCLEIGDRNTYQAFEIYKSVFQDTQNLIESRDADEILRQLIILLREVVQFSGLGLLLKEQIGEGFYLYFDHNLDDEHFHKLRWLERSGYIEWAGKEGRVSIIPNDELNAPSSSAVLIPLTAGKRSLGVLVVFLELDSNALTQHESELLSLIGSQAAVALKNAFLYRDLATKNHAMNNMKNLLEYSLESMMDGLFVLDQENKISLFNANAGKLLGIVPSHATGISFTQAFPSPFARFLENALSVTYTTGGFEGEVDFINPQNQKNYPLGIRMSVLRNSEKEPIGALVVCRDLSEQKELINLKKLDQLKDEFISAVSHELRTPLTSIKSFTEILLQFEEYDAETQKEFLHIIEKETNRLIEIVNDLLDLNRLSQGNLKLDFCPVDLVEVFQEALATVNILAESKGITILEKFDTENRWVKADSKRLIQVFINLLGNAIKFSPENTKIRVWSEMLPGKSSSNGTNRLMVCVEDEGIGIPEEYQKAIFERFKQVAPDPATKPDGSGLGLSICKRIVELHGGNIWVESEPNKGSKFCFTLFTENR